MTVPNLSKHAQVILDNLADGVILTNRSLHILYCNQYASRLLACPPSEMDGVSLAHFISTPSWPDKINPVRQGRLNEMVDEDFLTKQTGDKVTVRWSVRIAPADEGNQPNLLFQFRDVSAEKQLQEALDFAEFTVANASISVYWIDQNARFVYVNDAVCETLGYTREELLRMSVFDIDEYLFPENWEEHWANTRRKTPYRIMSSHRRKDGTYYPVEITPHYFEHNGCEYHITMTQNITDRKRSEEELARHREHLEAMVDERTRELRATNRQLTEEIEARKKNARDLAEQRKRTIMQFKAIPIPIYVWRKTGDEFLLVEYNDAAYTTTSGMVNEALNSPLPDLFGDQPEIVTDLKRCWVRQERIEKEIKVHFPYSESVLDLIVTYIPVNPDLVMVFTRDITQRNLALAKVEAGELRYRTIFDSSDDAMLMAVLEEVQDCNSAFLSMFGYQDKSVLSTINPATISPEFQPGGERSADLGERYLRKACEEGTAQFKWVCRRSNGDEFYASIWLRSFDLDNQRYLLASLRDITEQERATRERNEALARREELARIINRSQTYAFLWRNGENWPVEYVSANISNFGYTLDDFISGRIAYKDLIHPDDFARAYQEMESFSAESVQESLHQEYRLRTSEGRYRWVEDDTFPRRNKAGEVTHFEGILQDITERKQIAEELQRSGETAGVLLNNAHNMILLVDEKGTVLAINQKALNALLRAGNTDLTMSSVIGKNVYMMMPSRLADERRQYVAEALKTGKTIKIVESPINNLVYDTVIQPITEPDGSVKRVAVFVHDITDLKTTEQELRQALIKAQQAEEIKSSFLSHMSHEIRTPLNHVIGLSSLLLMQPDDLNVEARKYLKIINRSGESLLSIINAVLDLSKIETGKMQPIVEAFNIYDFLEEISDRFSVQAESDSLNFSLTVDPRLPATVRGDSFMLNRVLDNLLSNAIKFTPVGKVNLNVSIHEKERKSITLLFTVCDTGIGIPLDEYEKIFQSFYQVDGSAKRNYQGTGLGLTIAQEFVKLMNGRIWVESEAGQGSRFYFTCRFELS